MKNLLSILGILISLNINAQTIENQFKFNVEVDLIQPFLGGFGGTFGMENGKSGYGVMGFSTPLNNTARDIILKGAENYQVDNWGAEVYYDRFLKENHSGFYFGGLISLDGYEMNDNSSNTQTINGLYLAPRTGYRLTFKKINWLYSQASLAVPIKIWDNANDFKEEDIELSPYLLLPMLTLGVKF